MQPVRQPWRRWGCALLVLAACDAAVIVDPSGDGAQGAGGGTTGTGTHGSTSVGGVGGAPPSTGSTGEIPEGSWGAAAFGDRCGLEVTRGPTPDVPRLEWLPCEAPFTCGRWPASSGDGSDVQAADNLVRVVVAPDRVLLGTTLIDRSATPRLLTGVWDVATGELVVGWRVHVPDCSVVAFPGHDRVWLSVQDLGTSEGWQIHVDHQLAGGGYRILDHDYVGGQVSGNQRFYLTGWPGTTVWDAAVERWSVIEPRAFRWDLRDDGIHFISTEGEDWEEWTAWSWAPGGDPRKVVEPPPGKRVVHLTSNDDSLLWQIGPVEGGPPDLDKITELRRAPLPVTGLVEGEVVAVQPFRGVGRASRTRYVEVEPHADHLLHVVDLASGATSTIELPPAVTPSGVAFVGEVGGRVEEAWITTGAWIVRQPLPLAAPGGG